MYFCETLILYFVPNSSVSNFEDAIAYRKLAVQLTVDSAAKRQEEHPKPPVLLFQEWLDKVNSVGGEATESNSNTKGESDSGPQGDTRQVDDRPRSSGEGNAIELAADFSVS